MKAKILVVSQDSQIITPIIETLESEGHKITSIDLPGGVVEKCKTNKYDLMFIDVHIREITYDVIIKDVNKKCPETEVVVVTSYAFPESMGKGATLEIQGYLIQPLTPDKIKNVTNRALRQGELARENRRLLLAVTAAKKEWEATVDAIDDPIFVTDFDYNILRANLATFQRLSKGVNEVIGKKCYNIFHCSKQVLSECPGKQARDSGEPVNETLTFKGMKQRLSCSVYPQVFAGGGGLVHYLRAPAANQEQQAETMAKYERLFDDARLPIVFISSEDYKVNDANQKAIQLFRYEPQQLFDMDLENLFAKSLRESAINNIINQIQGKETPLRVKVVNRDKKETDAFIIANPIEMSTSAFVEIFIVPVDLLSGLREDK